jgi:hypothetical protein
MLYVPSLQDLHVVLPGCDVNFPLEHSVHFVAIEEEECVPGGHEVQTLAISAE